VSGGAAARGQGFLTSGGAPTRCCAGEFRVRWRRLRRSTNGGSSARSEEQQE
jgi:hypothetical protein